MKIFPLFSRTTFPAGQALLALALIPLLPAGAQTPKPKAVATPFQVPAAPEASALHVPAGFKVELVYSVPKGDQGSWVCLAIDPKGRITASDQYGGLYRITPSAGGPATAARVERLAITLPAVPGTEQIRTPERAAGTDGSASATIGAHGLLYAFDSLYVMVDEVPGRQGIWRLRDTDGDDQFDEIKFLRSMKGTGEHGTHALVLSPDGKSIYFANGNHTDLPAHWEKARPVSWGEDHLLPRMWDARGHAKDKYAPGGYIGRMDPEGKEIEIVTIGFRNQYDIAFNQNGELFTYDSDMEWDQGSPWYVPTRIVHAISGGDYGWRSGAGRWPAYYADSLPPALDVGPGSPTGITFGTKAKFPAKYQRALFACDWTYGTMYAMHLTPEGSTYRAAKEEFVAGKALPLTDVVINPVDGAMYFTVGGRRTQSALYRVTYTGSDSTTPATIPPLTPAAEVRRSLEALQEDGVGPEAIEKAWPNLASPDRFLRFAARIAIECQPPEKWAERALAELLPQASIEALIALARVGDKSLQPRLIEALSRLDFAKQPAELRQPFLRAWQLAFTRLGKPSPEVCAGLAAKFDPLFPHADPLVNRELVSLLIYLGSPTVVAKTVPLLSVAEPPVAEWASDALLARNDRYAAAVLGAATSRPDRQQIAYAYALRNATTGWTPQLRKDYFSWFPRTQGWRGGASFSGFIKNIRTEALAQAVADPAERTALDARSQIPVQTSLASGISPKGPGRNYTVNEATTLVGSKLSGRNFAQGREMFSAVACTACHRFNNEGISIGPDISGAGSRYSVRDLLENIIEPSLVISDQYANEQVDKTDGSTVVGRVIASENNALLFMVNPFAPDENVRVMLTEIKARKTSPVSLMPPGLINALSPEELKDLLAYILSGGNARDAMFKK